MSRRDNQLILFSTAPRRHPASTTSACSCSEPETPSHYLCLFFDRGPVSSTLSAEVEEGHPPGPSLGASLASVVE